jgi:molybdate transport system substrate-binding protein
MTLRPVAAGIFALVAACFVAGCGDDAGRSTTAAKPLLIAAASDLRPALTTLAAQYERQTGQRITVTYGASGQLAKQLANGAPYALFASASVDYVDEVLAAGRGDRSTRAIYAYGRLAVWSPDHPVALAQLAQPSVRTVAIANPEHAPYGKAAVQALRAAGLYSTVKPKLVFGDNVAAAQQLAASGNADAAIIGRSLALASGGSLTDVNRALHRPIAQGLLVTGSGQAAANARAFAALLTGPSGRTVLEHDGFILPADTPTPAAAR